MESMLQINDYSDTDSMISDIMEFRRKSTTMMNPNPVVVVNIFCRDGEYYTAHVYWNGVDKTWICSVNFYGKNNQGQEYWQYKGVRKFSKLRLLCSSLRTMASAGESRINLSTSKWHQINIGQNPNKLDKPIYGV